MNKIYLATLVSLALLAGCETDTTPSKTGYAPTDPANVKVYEHVPKVPFETLGNVAYLGLYVPANSGADRLGMGEQADFLGELRKQAAALGADAVIIKEKSIYDPQDASGVENNDMGSGRRMRLAGIAIRFRPAAQRPAGPAPAPAMAPASP
jgi:hypothetical protein